MNRAYDVPYRHVPKHQDPPPAETAATTGELEAAARQFVRKISGYRTPSARNRDAFEAAVAEIARVVRASARGSWASRSRRARSLDPRVRDRVTPRRLTPVATAPLPGGVGPGSTSRDGRLTIAGEDAEALARAHGTPLFVYDLARFAENARRLQAALAGAGLRRSGSGSRSRPTRCPRSSRSSAAWVRPGRRRASASTPARRARCARAIECGWRPDEISYTGTNVSERDLDVLLGTRVHVNLDAISQIERSVAVRRDADRRAHRPGRRRRLQRPSRTTPATDRPSSGSAWIGSTRRSRPPCATT